MSRSRRRNGGLGIWRSVALASLVASAGLAEELNVAVASNFSEPATILASRFEEQTGHKLQLVFGSTGKHYAQIVNGAPFDVFLAADVERPQLLEKQGRAIAGSRFTYARGRLVLWSPRVDLVDSSGRVLRLARFEHLALANPRLSPYGRAAKEVLESLGAWGSLRTKVVTGENINQAFHFVISGNAELGLVAWSQISPSAHEGGSTRKGSQWVVPKELYQPIRQQAVLLQDRPGAREFLELLQTDKTRELIRAYGYCAP